MGGDDHDRRRAAISSVLEHAAGHSVRRLPYDELREVTAVFSSRRELVLALQYHWSQLLWARIDLLSRTAKGTALADARGLAGRAWSDCAARHPVLRRLLDEHLAELGSPMQRSPAAA